VQQPAGKVDLLFAVHTGDGMGSLRSELSESAADLISRFDAVTGRFHIGVIGTDASSTTGGELNAAPGAPRYVVPCTGDVTNLHDNLMPGPPNPGTNLPPDESLESLRLSVLSPGNGGFFRSDTHLAVVIVSNAVERSPASLREYTNPLLTPRGSILDGLQTTRLYGLISPAACGPNTRYRELFGLFGEQCYSLESGSIDQQVMAIADDLLKSQASFDLSDVVDDGQPFQVLVDGAPLPIGTYSLEAGSKVLRFSDLNVPEPGQQIDVTYTPICHAQNL
jgi:hypothetical protein